MKSSTLLQITILHFAILFFALWLVQTFIVPNLLSAPHFLNWDAEHYHFIKSKGYSDFRVAFFPLFPLSWRFMGLGTYGIVGFNLILFMLTLVYLVKNLNLKNMMQFMLFLSLPSFIFFCLPYSESLFFLFGSLIAIGYLKNQFPVVLIGLFFAVVTRPSFTVLLPALLLTDLFTLNLKVVFRRFVAYILVTTSGILSVAWLQYIETGEWFQFFAVQSGWGNALQWPSLPLTSWSGGFITRADGMVFFIGLSATAALFLYFFHRIKSKKISIEPVLLLSLFYLAGMTFLVLFFRGGSLFSLNRFILATPFALIVFQNWLSKDYQLNMKQIGFVFFGILLYWLLFGSFVHIQAFAKYTAVSFYLLLLFLVHSETNWLKKTSYYVLLAVNFIFQVLFFIRFLSDEWVG